MSAGELRNLTNAEFVSDMRVLAGRATIDLLEEYPHTIAQAQLQYASALKVHAIYDPVPAVANLINSVLENTSDDLREETIGESREWLASVAEDRARYLRREVALAIALHAPLDAEDTSKLATVEGLESYAQVLRRPSAQTE